MEHLIYGIGNTHQAEVGQRKWNKPHEKGIRNGSKSNCNTANNQFANAPATTQKVKRKVAGYARVSTDFEEQLTSYEAQVDYYTKYIQEREDWEFVKVYTDEGISATSTVHRDGFNQMVADALDGKIDLIVTKSVSRLHEIP